MGRLAVFGPSDLWGRLVLFNHRRIDSQTQLRLLVLVFAMHEIGGATLSLRFRVALNAAQRKQGSVTNIVLATGSMLQREQS